MQFAHSGTPYEVLYIKQATTDMIRSYLERLYTKQKFTPATVARKMAALRLFYTYLVREGIVASNPLTAIATVPVPTKAPLAATAEAIEALVTSAEPITGPLGLRNYAIIRVLVYAGVTVAELVALHGKDVLLAADGSIMLRCANRVGRERRILLDEHTANALLKYIRMGRTQLALPTIRVEGPVFVNSAGTALTRQGAWLVVSTLAKQAGVEGVTPQSLRHAFARRSLNDGMTLKTLQTTLGHASRSTTRMYESTGARGRKRGPVRPGSIKYPELEHGAANPTA